MADDRQEEEDRGMAYDEEEDDVVEDEEDGEFVLNEEDMIVINDDDEYIPTGGGDDDGEEDEALEGEEAEDVVDESIHVFTGHGKQPVYAVAAAHKSDTLASGGGDDRAFVWTPQQSKGTVLGKHEDSVVAVSFSSDDSWVASAGMDGVIHVRQVATQKELTLDGPGADIEWIAWHPKHLVLLGGSADTTVWMWNVAEGGMIMGVFAGHTDSVTCGAFTPNGRRVITGSMDGSLKLWEPNGTSLIHTFSGHQFHQGGIVSMATKTEGDPLVATGGSDGSVCLIRLDTKKILAKFQHGEPNAQPKRDRYDDDEEVEDQEEEEEGCSVETVAFCPTLPWLVSGGTDGRVVVWDLSVQAKRSVLMHPDSEAVVRCLFLPQSVHLITACADGKVRKWDVRASQMEKALTGHQDAILDMALLHDGKRVVTASDDGTCRIFQVVA